MAGQTIAPTYPSNRPNAEKQHYALPPPRWPLETAEQLSVETKFNSLRHWLVLALVIERPSYGYELAARYDRRFAAFLPLGAGNVYSSLDQLERYKLITQQHSVELRATRGARGKRAY